MKKLLFPVLLSVVSLLACVAEKPISSLPIIPIANFNSNLITLSTSHNTDSGAAPTLPAPTQPVVVSGSNWSFTLPDDTWKKLDAPAPEIIAYYYSANSHNLILFARDEFSGNLHSYVSTTLRGIKDAGGTIIASKQLTINGNKMVVIESIRDGIDVLMFLLVKEGMGWNFACGGPMIEDNSIEVCKKVANTIVIKN